MPSSSNTFGTFLNTFSTLEKQSSVDPSTASATVRKDSFSAKDVLRIVENLSISGSRKTIKDLVAISGLPREDLLSAVMQGKNQGLIEVSDENGESVANLTPLGKAFAS